MPIVITFKAEGFGAIKFVRTIEFRSELIEGETASMRETVEEMASLAKSVSDFAANDLSALDTLGE